MPTLTKGQLQIQYEDVLGGLDKHVTADMTLGGVVFSPAQLRAVFARALAALLASDGAHAAMRASVAAASAAEAEAKGIYTLLKSVLLGIYGEDAFVVLGDFGMPVPKPKGVMTVATKAEAIARRALTRQLRHTMGSQQKKLVKGTVEVTNPALEGSTPPPAAANEAKPKAS